MTNDDSKHCRMSRIGTLGVHSTLRISQAAGTGVGPGVRCVLIRYVVFDVETTGLDPARGHRIIEIAAVVLVENDPAEEFHSFVNAGKPVPKAVQEMHGITTEMLTSQPKVDEVMPKFQEFIGSSTLVAHNADFDISFLRYEFDRLGLTLANRCRCTLKMSRKRYPRLPNYRLETVAAHLLGMSCEGGRRHRALDDARLTARIWLEMRRR
jgi:DNA polymerase III subunit epsilon